MIVILLRTMMGEINKRFPKLKLLLSQQIFTMKIC